MNFLAVSGEAATRASPASLSLRTAIFKPWVPCALPPSPLFADDENDDHRDDGGDDRAPFHQAGEACVGALMRLEILIGLAFGCHDPRSSCFARPVALA